MLKIPLSLQVFVNQTNKIRGATVTHIFMKTQKFKPHIETERVHWLIPKSKKEKIKKAINEICKTDLNEKL